MLYKYCPPPPPPVSPPYPAATHTPETLYDGLCVARSGISPTPLRFKDQVAKPQPRTAALVCHGNQQVAGSNTACVRVCVCGRVSVCIWINVLTYVFECVCIQVYICISVCTHAYLLVHVCVCVCVCVCACVCGNQDSVGHLHQWKIRKTHTVIMRVERLQGANRDIKHQRCCSYALHSVQQCTSRLFCACTALYINKHAGTAASLARYISPGTHAQPRSRLRQQPSVRGKAAAVGL